MAKWMVGPHGRPVKRSHGASGKCFGYGAQGGTLIVQGDADSRAGIRLSGADLIIAGKLHGPLSDELGCIASRANIKGFAFEYMTSGRDLVLGDPGPWLCSGMTGGVVYLKLDEVMGLDEAALRRRLAKGAEVSIEAVGKEAEQNLKELLGKYINALDAHEQKQEAEGVRLLQEVQPMGYTGGVDTVRRFVRTLPSYRERQRKLKMTVGFETAPGEQAQADWAYCGQFSTPTGEVVKLYAFVMVLSFSRYLFVRFTTDMQMETLLRCHQAVFAYFGGWPQTILYDNMKSVKLSAEQWNPQLVGFTNHYGIAPRTHRVRRPRTKGKVERMVEYLKDNFLNGRSFADLADLQAQALVWLAEVNARVHATTQQQPCALLSAENLTPLAAITPYRVRVQHGRQVNAEGFVHLARRRYSVPPTYVGEQVVVEQEQQRVVIRCGDVVIALAAPSGATVAAPMHRI